MILKADLCLNIYEEKKRINYFYNRKQFISKEIAEFEQTVTIYLNMILFFKLENQKLKNQRRWIITEK